MRRNLDAVEDHPLHQIRCVERGLAVREQHVAGAEVDSVDPFLTPSRWRVVAQVDEGLGGLVDPQLGEANLGLPRLVSPAILFFGLGHR